MLYTKLLFRLPLALGREIKDPVHPGVYPRLSVVLPGVNVSEPVTAPLGSVYDVEPPVETNNPPEEILAPAVKPRSLQGKGPAVSLYVP